MKKFLVTGGAGFIGSWLVGRLAGMGEVVVLDKVDRPMDGCESVVSDIRDGAGVAKALDGVDAVFHLAAFVSAPLSVTQSEECRSVNVDGTKVLLEEMRKKGIAKVVFASSAAVYGNAEGRIDESRPTSPQSPYAQTKLDCESLVFWHSGEATCFRFFNVYGAGQKLDSGYAALVPAVVRAGNADDELVVYGDGHQSRDFIYVEDVVDAVAKIGLENSGLFNLGTGMRTTVLEVVKSVEWLLGKQIRVRFEQERIGDVRHSLADVSKIAAVGFRNFSSLMYGLNSTLKRRLCL